MLLWHYELTLPLGPMWAAFDDRGRLRRLKFGTLNPRATMPLPPKSQREVFRFLVRQFEAYFAGTLRTFTVPIDLAGSEFQQRVWDEVLGVAYGKTLELEKLVKRVGPGKRPEVEAALRDNPVEILVPTHRVIDPEGVFAYVPGSAIQKALLTHEGGPTPLLHADTKKEATTG